MDPSCSPPLREGCAGTAQSPPESAGSLLLEASPKGTLGPCLSTTPLPAQPGWA